MIKILLLVNTINNKSNQFLKLLVSLFNLQKINLKKSHRKKFKKLKILKYPLKNLLLHQLNQNNKKLRIDNYKERICLKI